MGVRSWFGSRRRKVGVLPVETYGVRKGDRVVARFAPDPKPTGTVTRVSNAGQWADIRWDDQPERPNRWGFDRLARL